jgi:CRP-like cAMP-binding protein
MMTAALPQISPASDGQFETLARIAPFQGLPEAVLKLLYVHSERRTYNAGQTVFSLGQYDGGEFLVVLSGALRISLTDGETGAMMIEDVGEAGIFGLEIAISEPDPSLFNQIAVTAEKDSDVIVVDATEFKTLAASRPSLMRNIAIYLGGALAAHRFRAATAQSAPEQRVYAALLECVTRDPISGRWRIERMPKHRELADRAGVDEAAAAAAVAVLIQEGVAQRDYPGLIVNDMARLNQLAS